MSIPIQFGLFWSGKKMSYLRYMTFKSLRHFHPDSKIRLYVSDFKSDDVAWWVEKQDFQGACEYKDYFEELGKLDIEIVQFDTYRDYLPNFQSDFFRWWYLKEHGGFYLDTDQIILRSFKDLPLDVNLIYSTYKTVSCGLYAPVGVIGASKDSIVVDKVNNNIKKFYSKNQYNSIGPEMFRTILGDISEPSSFNSPSHFFYPVKESWEVTDMYAKQIKIPEDSFALHWFGGNAWSQKYNDVFSKEFAEQTDDTISNLVKKFGWL